MSRWTHPLNNPDSRFHAASMEEVDAKLADEGWATGADVWEQVEKAYTNYVGGDGELAQAQLASLRWAWRNGDD